MPIIGSGITFGPGITIEGGVVQEGLALDLDATNLLSTRGQRSIINWNTWTVGTGSATGYNQNGDGNSRLSDVNPWGNNDIVWQSLNNDVTSDADGGWNTTTFSIDNSKAYRFSTWVKRKVLGNGSFYLGLYGYNSAPSNVGVLNRSNGAVNTNPYFTSFGWTLNVDEWYLVVGHVWPVGSGTGAIHSDTGIYNSTGTKISNISDFVWQDTNVNAAHRSYLYYSTDPATNQQWYQPRVDVIDGTEPSIDDLIDNAGNTWYDMSGRNNHSSMFYGPSFSTTPGYFTLDGVSQYGSVINNATLNFASEQTITLIMRHNFTSGRRNPWNQAYGGYGTLTHEAGANINYYYGDAGVNAQPYTALNSGTTNSNVWNILTVTRNTSTVTWYQNGVQTNTMANPYADLTTTAANILIGTGYAGYWQGDMSRIMAHTRALTSTEVLQNFEFLRSTYGL